MVKYDQASFDKLIREVLFSHSEYIHKFETGHDILKDDYDKPIAVVPFISIELKTDAQYIADLHDNKAIRIKP